MYDPTRAKVTGVLNAIKEAGTDDPNSRWIIKMLEVLVLDCICPWEKTVRLGSEPLCPIEGHWARPELTEDDGPDQETDELIDAANG